MSEHFFIVLEGLDGSGKSEVSRRIMGALRQSVGERVLQTFEPHDASAGGAWLRGVLARKITTTPRGLALGFALNRLDHNEQVIAPFLAGGDQRVVICDRYYLSSLTYQSVSPLTMDAVMALNQDARRPDLTLFLDASAETCYQRMGWRAQKDPELFERDLSETREKYEKAITYLQERGEKIITVNADAGLLDVVNSVIDVINANAPSWLRLARLESLTAASAMNAPVSVLRPAMNAYEKFLPFIYRLGEKS